MNAAPSAAIARPPIAGAVVVAIVIALCCWLSLLTRMPGSLSTLWIASGVLAGILLTSPKREWPAFLVAALAANLLVRWSSGDAWYLVAGRGLASTLDAWILAAWLVRSVGDVTAPDRVKRVATLSVGMTIAACGLSAAIAAGFQSAFGGAAFGAVYAAWFASHALGMVIFATLTVVARAQGRRLLGRPGHRFDLVLSLLLVAVTSFAVFSQSRYPVFFVIYPTLLLAAVRHRFPGVVYGVTIVAAIAISRTLAGDGPLAAMPQVGPTQRVLLLQLFIASACLLALPVAVVLAERRELARSLRESEHRYRTLADYSRDLVVRLAADGRRLYISPSAQDLLGWDMSEFARERFDLIHPDDAAPLREAVDRLFAEGGSATLVYRMRHKLGHYVWIEAQAQRVPSLQPDAPPELIYSGRDVTHRREAERALAENQRRLRAITDNLPAFVLHVDTDERYTFANEPTYRTMGFAPGDIIGRTIRELIGEHNYAEIKPNIDRAFAGESVSFEIQRDFKGQRYHYQSTYVPERDADGRVCGLYVMSSDISQLKRTEQELTLLARYDGLTGIANRFHFIESCELGLARHRRSGRPLALLYLDIDHFKRINDTLGHAVGDGVLREFALRLRNCLRATDFAARLGGDEFVALIEDADDCAVPETVARKMIAAMHAPIVVDDHLLPVTTSIGIAYCDGQCATRDQLLHVADGALYEAKAAGRNTWRSKVVDASEAGERFGAA